MTKQHFTTIAIIIAHYKRLGEVFPQGFEEKLAEYFTEVNPKFNEQLFLKACK